MGGSSRIRSSKPNRIFQETDFYSALTIILLLAVFAYACVRANTLPISYDEANTYLAHATQPIYNILTYTTREDYVDNNHLLNTLLIKAFTEFLGVSEFTIRIPALIGCALYLVGMYCTLKMFLKEHHLLLGALFMASNPFMLDYFSAARGFSLGLGFTMLAIYFLFKRIKQKENGQVCNDNCMLWSCWMLFFAMLANLAFTYPLLSIMCLFALFELRYSRLLAEGKVDLPAMAGFLKKVFLCVVCPIVILFLIYVGPVTRILDWDYFYGGSEGFWKDTVESLLWCTMYLKYYTLGDLILPAYQAIVVGFPALSCLALGYKFVKKKKFWLDDYYILVATSTLLLCALIFMVQHFLLNTKFLMGRTAIFFIPLFMLLMLLLWEKSRAIRQNVVRNAVNISFHLLILVMLAHSINCINFDNPVSLWGYDASLEDVLTDVAAMSEEQHLKGEMTTLNVNWIFSQNIKIYMLKHRIDWISAPFMINPDGTIVEPSPGFDYYYIVGDDTWPIFRNNLDIVKTYDKPRSIFLDTETPKYFSDSWQKQYATSSSYLAVPHKD